MGIANSFNSGKALCYIPIIGTFGGILRIASTRYGTRRGSTPSANKGILVRGVFEICSLGILLILPDLIVTVVRSLKK
jgi:hypothetical protein